MSGTRITAVDAWEVLDSRGHPTVRVAVDVGDARGTFTVPAGASTGSHEAVERRDGGARYGGRGVREAVRAVREELAPVVLDRDATAQEAIDRALLERDGTSDLSRCGANAVLGVSGAVCRAASGALGLSLYEYLAAIAGRDPGRLPLPEVNVLSGGLHAAGGIELQDFLVVPIGASTYPAALETVWDVRSAVRDRLLEDGHRPLVADEGGFAPPLSGIDEAFELLVGAVAEAGYDLGREVAFSVDIAATHFYDSAAGSYALESLDRTLDRDAMIDLVCGWTETYPIVAIEDPLAEDDWAGWQHLADRLAGTGTLLIGDDLLATNPDRLDRAIETEAASAVLVKPNQAGTITRTLAVIERAQDAGVATIVSARSGETADTTIADLSVGLDAGWIKIGSLARSERLAKYNRLLEIAREGDRGFAATDVGPVDRE